MNPLFKVEVKATEGKSSLQAGLSKHRHSKSLGIPLSYSKTSKAKPRLSIALLSNSSKTTKAKLGNNPSQPFPLSGSTSRLIKITKSSGEDKSLWKLQKFPLFPEKVLKLFKSHLTPFEEIEILTYDEIWFIGIGAHKVKTGVKNNGFDEDDGGYRVIFGDHLAYRYEILGHLGSGSFGTVVRVLDHMLKKEFAIKIIKNKQKFSEIALEEIEILQYLQVKDPSDSFKISHLLDQFYFRNHSCLKFELLGMSLYQYMKINSFQGFPTTVIKKAAKQLLTCLKSLEKCEVIHCDLKPENILFKDSESLELKVIDFGSATFNHKRFYNYIQSRYYRSPEILLGLPYSSKIDIWSLGCLLAELFLGRPIFPGESETDQIFCIMEIFGPPPLELIRKAGRRKLYFENDLSPKVFTNSKGKTRTCSSRSLNEVLKGADLSFIEFISQCLSWDPSKRLSPQQGLEHEWLAVTETRSKHIKTQSHAVFSFSKLLGRPNLKLY
jgi:serine/threonine protein kinase